ncbi:MAG TPA: SIR2 family protein [Candidatus Acidoferrales bacterium]|nr:SIR2 family protein [Candidatus Acidoferrales bacterium]
MTSRSKDIIFLLGAGASAEAGIPVSGEMINLVEKSLKAGTEQGLYHHVKSAIHFSAGLKGRFGNAVPFNIETLVNTLYELERNEEHPLYPFIAAWSSRFVALAGPDFGEVRRFRQRILADLKKWMCPEDSAKADYYRGLIALQRDLNYPLHVFSLNYDLCVEGLNTSEFRVETGFANFGPSHSWDWERFVDMETSNNIAPQLVLYKLHGSINWKRSPETKELFCVQQIESVDAEKMEVIFGREFKLEAADPYLFFAYKFRDLSLVTKLIVTLGYGFGDVHINKMLTQSLRTDSERRLLAIQGCEEKDCVKKANEIEGLLELGDDRTYQVIVQPGSAKQFLETPKLNEQLVKLIPPSKDVPF